MGLKLLGECKLVKPVWKHFGIQVEYTSPLGPRNSANSECVPQETHSTDGRYFAVKPLITKHWWGPRPYGPSQRGGSTYEGVADLGLPSG